MAASGSRAEPSRGCLKTADEVNALGSRCECLNHRRRTPCLNHSRPGGQGLIEEKHPRMNTHTHTHTLNTQQPTQRLLAGQCVLTISQSLGQSRNPNDNQWNQQAFFGVRMADILPWILLAQNTRPNKALCDHPIGNQCHSYKTQARKNKTARERGPQALSLSTSLRTSA